MRAREIDYLFDLRADFDAFLLRKDWKQARACINEMGERGQENEAMKMHKEYNDAKNYLCVGTQGGCNGDHTTYCKDFNSEGAGRNEGEVTERSLRADETYD